MQMKPLLLLLFVSNLLLSVPFVLATEEAEAVADAAAVPGGVSTLMFLLGVGAIILVGGAMLARDSFKSDNSE